MPDSSAEAATPGGSTVHNNVHDASCRIDTVSHPRLNIHQFHDPIGSTQDEARRLLRELSPEPQGPFLVIIADQQTNGRGTKGRKWEGGSESGNLYLTICIPFGILPVMPTLLPLQVAVLVADETLQSLSKCREGAFTTESEDDVLSKAKVGVKWPNDVLINEKKLAGILIESETVEANTWLLVGIGTNIAFAPNLDHSPGKSGRGSTCIQEHCLPSRKGSEGGKGGDGHDKSGSSFSTTSAYDFGVHVSQRLVDWILDTRTPKAVREKMVVDKWKSYAEFGTTYEVRGSVEEENGGSYQGEQVVSLDIQYDGQLLVRGQNGRDRLLVADYLF
ncbi:hypothetical protein ACA910_019435 [Epithemia clementina (nom. ined.)]